MTEQPAQTADYSAEHEEIAAALRPVLTSLGEQCRSAASIYAAMPMIHEVARVIAGLFVEQLQAASVASFNEGVAAGMLRSAGGTLQ